jgi:hypothetical protein
MQTFLPYSSFPKSAEVLDKKRAWKQVVEAAQILDVLEGRKTGWRNHPAVKMWDGHTLALKEYFNTFLDISIRVHKINTKYKAYEVYEGCNYPDGYPWWLGNKDFHRAMRARLIEKDEAFYLHLFPKDKGFNDSKYFWPVNETQTFRII